MWPLEASAGDIRSGTAGWAVGWCLGQPCWLVCFRAWLSEPGQVDTLTEHAGVSLQHGSSWARGHAWLGGDPQSPTASPLSSSVGWPAIQAHLIASGGTLSPPPDGGRAGLQRRVLNPPLKNVICQQGDVRKVRWGKLTRHRLLPDGVNSYVGPQPTPFTYISTVAALNPAQKPETFTLCLMKLQEIHTGLCPHFLTQGNTLGTSRVMGEVRVPTLSSWVPWKLLGLGKKFFSNEVILGESCLRTGHQKDQTMIRS